MADPVVCGPSQRRGQAVGIANVALATMAGGGGGDLAL